MPKASHSTDNRTGRFGPLLLIPALLVGCATTGHSPDQTPPPVTVPESFSQTGDLTAPGRWWRAFDDNALEQLIQDALGQNLDLRAAYERLRQSRAVLERESASLYPNLSGNASAETRRSDTASADSETVTLGLSSEYEVDLWGRIDAQVDAQQFQVRASRADYQTAALSLAGELTNTWFQLLEQRAQLDLAHDQLETNRNVLSLIRRQFASGQANSADVLRQQQLVESSRERILTVESRIGVLRHQLSVLLGEAPLDETLPDGRSLPTAGPLPDTGIPSELVQRRPDIQQRYNALKAADAELGAAMANRWPRLTLTASVTTRENSVNDLFDNWTAGLAGNLVAPLIDAGQRDAEVARTRSVRQQRLYEFGQSILIAFQEVEDALIQERKQRRRIKSQSQQLKLADATYDQRRSQYVNGVVDYIDVLTALQDRQELRRALLSARRQLLDYRIALYRALAGPLASAPSDGETPNDTTD
ncbi:NodT family efflux transporter outer membrane factor (OMF) lipoprotein [Tamilnaduibacter salinus]|uniref:NodT family efflux transporter outer membrane factor (OMF) lipoprotein n=1 Tax=Tamilnaduibacter salinus TaxID=1484056 RepID=A0A2U1D057_9GAMM|nr:efflux transporter outer membrane subunit [Tamilnaduibacter salinus]PVY78426.1 NodT family efflux transporter outer membrane factor (OMF) lipoprotein [Tamilnaduibacter salinus]